MNIRIMDNESLLKYHKAQSRILYLTRQLLKGEDCYPAILKEYSKMCIPVKPNPVERAFMLMLKERQESMRRVP